jgi:hypothetical protein
VPGPTSQLQDVTGGSELLDGRDELIAAGFVETQ